MDWASVLFGAFLGVAATFGLLALALFPVMKQSFLLWIGARTFGFCIMAIAMFPGSFSWLTDDLAVRTDIAEIAIGLAVGCTGPLLASYIEDQFRLRRIRRWLNAQFLIGIAAAFATVLGARWPIMDRVHDALLLVVASVVVYGLVIAIRAGSRLARFQAAAWFPLIAIGCFVMAYEWQTGSPLPYWVSAALIAIFLDFIISAVGLADGFMAIENERDEAVAHVKAAKIAVATDPLTGIANRRGLAKQFDDRTSGRPSGIAVLDCDHFKRINDQFGHDVGDEVLVAVAHGLVDDSSFPARLGGEEFVILFYSDDWQRSAETIRRRLTVAVLELVPAVPFPVTASAGITEIRGGDTLESALKRADLALYAAKDAGRDQLRRWHDSGNAKPRLISSV